MLIPCGATTAACAAASVTATSLAPTSSFAVVLALLAGLGSVEGGGRGLGGGEVDNGSAEFDFSINGGEISHGIGFGKGVKAGFIVWGEVKKEAVDLEGFGEAGLAGFEAISYLSHASGIVNRSVTDDRGTEFPSLEAAHEGVRESTKENGAGAGVSSCPCDKFWGEGSHVVVVVGDDGEWSRRRAARAAAVGEAAAALARRRRRGRGGEWRGRQRLARPRLHWRGGGVEAAERSSAGGSGWRGRGCASAEAASRPRSGAGGGGWRGGRGGGVGAAEGSGAGGRRLARPRLRWRGGVIKVAKWRGRRRLARPRRGGRGGGVGAAEGSGAGGRRLARPRLRWRGGGDEAAEGSGAGGGGWRGRGEAAAEAASRPRREAARAAAAGEAAAKQARRPSGYDPRAKPKHKFSPLTPPPLLPFPPSHLPSSSPLPPLSSPLLFSPSPPRRLPVPFPPFHWHPTAQISAWASNLLKAVLGPGAAPPFKPPDGVTPQCLENAVVLRQRDTFDADECSSDAQELRRIVRAFCHTRVPAVPALEDPPALLGEEGMDVRIAFAGDADNWARMPWFNFSLAATWIRQECAVFSLSCEVATVPRGEFCRVKVSSLHNPILVISSNPFFCPPAASHSPQVLGLGRVDIVIGPWGDRALDNIVFLLPGTAMRMDVAMKDVLSWVSKHLETLGRRQKGGAEEGEPTFLETCVHRNLRY
ncbi:unnamed protein product [Closterium sp. NIES-65]|nr:unnamed protein product [Closterium sp. NIES-65]